jgi:hypothetical protein
MRRHAVDFANIAAREFGADDIVVLGKGKYGV